MLKKNKKAIDVSPEFFMRLVLSLIFAFAVIFIACSVVKIPKEGVESYNKLVEEISKLQDGISDSMPLIMDKKTAIFMFNKDSDKITVSSYDDSFIFIYPRPSGCVEGKACAYLCSKGEVSSEGNTYTFLCTEGIAKGLDKEGFYHEPVYSTGPGVAQDSTRYFSGGLIIQRELYQESEPGGLVKVYKSTPERFTVYLQQKGNLVGVCEKSPCIPGTS